VRNNPSRPNLNTAHLFFSRFAAGFLNGNLSVIKSVFGDITDSTNRPAAFAFNQILWATGGTIGYVNTQLGEILHTLNQVICGWPSGLPVRAISDYI
jgi:hypothetical protein